MPKFNYQKICQDLTQELPSRTSDIVFRRFGLEDNRKETLASIGEDYNVTRERIRQIEEDALSKLKSASTAGGREARSDSELKSVFGYFQKEIKKFGELKREDTLLSYLGGIKFENEVYFLLSLDHEFERRPKTKKFHSLWTINPKSISLAGQVVDSLVGYLKQGGDPVHLDHIDNAQQEIFAEPIGLDRAVLSTFVELSRKIKQGPTGELGLRDWPEINPRGVRDRAFLVLRKEGKPLHFTKVTALINEHFPKIKNQSKVEALPQTVHNELIKDGRFVLVGRGIYALKQWGYKSGTVKDVITKVLKEKGKSLSRQEIVKEVLAQRMVKKNTILLNLQNKDCFKKDEQGRYTLKA